MIDPPEPVVYAEGQETDPLTCKPNYTPDRIRQLRDDLGMTQEEFAARLGYSRVHVSRLENGKKTATKVLDIALESIAREARKGK